MKLKQPENDNESKAQRREATMFSFPEAAEQLKQAATAAAAAVVQGGELKAVRHQGVMSLGTAEV